MSVKGTTNPTDDQALEITRAIARLKAGVLALIFGFIGGAGLFVATVWLVLEARHVPEEMRPYTGMHLGLLAHYFPGYRVTWGGAFVGLFYGALTGGIVGWALGYLYNRVVGLRQR